jgi:phenylalanyl-tRNA synthetase beta chain
MKISLNWLRDYVDFDLTAAGIGELLSDRGFPYESIEEANGDTVIDVEVTSNRGDCLSHIGIARELAAATGKQLKLPAVSLPQSDKPANTLVKVEIAEPTLCGRYTARVIENIKVGPTPEWMRKRLEAVGLRSINNVVDATNYAMMETGQPPHAFDFAKIGGAKIVVRKAAAGERITSIDGTKCELNPNMLVIADAEKPVAIAGVMGGLDTEVGDSTVTVLLEDAQFSPLTVRTTSRKLALPSDAAYRFERLVDIEMIDWASQRTAQLITQVAGGTVAKGLVDAYPAKPAQKKLTLRLNRLAKVLGFRVAPKDVLVLLDALQFQPQLQNNDFIQCIVPSWRNDVYREIDLIEEFARMYGYDKIRTEQKISIEVAPVDPRQKFLSDIRTFVNGCGYFETVNVTFIDDLTASLFSGGKSGHLSVQDVTRKSANLLRQTLLGSLAQCLKTNYNAKNTPCRLYEIADTFKPNHENLFGSGLPEQKCKLALISDGDFRELRGVVEGLVRMLNRESKLTFTPAELIWAKAGANIIVNGKTIGVAGVLSDTVLEKLDIKGASPCGAELDFESLANLQTGIWKVKPLPRFPAIERDISIIVDETVRWSDIESAVGKKAVTQLEDIRFVGIYRGKPIDAGKKSVTLALRFRDEDGTLTHDMVDTFQNTIMQELSSTLSAVLRTT